MSLSESMLKEIISPSPNLMLSGAQWALSLFLFYITIFVRISLLFFLLGNVWAVNKKNNRKNTVPRTIVVEMLSIFFLKLTTKSCMSFDFQFKMICPLF